MSARRARALVYWSYIPMVGVFVPLVVWCYAVTLLQPSHPLPAARATARATVLGVDVRRTFFSATPAGRVRAIEERIEALEEEDRTLVDRADTLARRLAHLDGIAAETRTFAAGLATGRATVDA